MSPPSIRGENALLASQAVPKRDACCPRSFSVSNYPSVRQNCPGILCLETHLTLPKIIWYD
jgi:hypothetical protein